MGDGGMGWGRGWVGGGVVLVAGRRGSAGEGGSADSSSSLPAFVFTALVQYTPIDPLTNASAP